MKKIILLTFTATFIFIGNVNAQKKKKSTLKSKYNSELFNALKFRSVGPAFTSGRVADIAVNYPNEVALSSNLSEFIDEQLDLNFILYGEFDGNPKISTIYANKIVTLNPSTNDDNWFNVTLELSTLNYFWQKIVNCTWERIKNAKIFKKTLPKSHRYDDFS